MYTYQQKKISSKTELINYYGSDIYGRLETILCALLFVNTSFNN